MDYELYCNGRHIPVKGHTGDHICSALWGTKHFYEEALLQDVRMRHPIQGTIIEVLMNRGMTDEEALEYFDFNIGCLYAGPGTPTIVQML